MERGELGLVGLSSRCVKLFIKYKTRLTSIHAPNFKRLFSELLHCELRIVAYPDRKAQYRPIMNSQSKYSKNKLVHTHSMFHVICEKLQFM